MRRILVTTLIVCASTGTLGAAGAGARIACLGAPAVARASGFAATSTQPVNMGVRVVCVYTGSAGQVSVTYAVGQPFTTFMHTRLPGAKTLKGVGDAAYTASTGGQASVYGIVKGKAEFVVTGPLSLAKEVSLSKAVAASLR